MTKNWLVALLLWLLMPSVIAQIVAPIGSGMSIRKLEQLTEVYQSKQEMFAGFAAPITINELILENSPYLVRHATNPVNWKAWSAAVFAQAKAQNKPIFLSIGYSTCHWCHEMEQDSFVKSDIAALINQHFIAVKVDRELHPAVDELYTSALELVTGSSGWPVTAVLNAKGEPLFINSFLSHAQLTVLLNRLAAMWQSNPAYLNQSAANIMALVKQQQQLGAVVKWEPSTLNTSTEKVRQQLDPQYGGYVGEPKFPAEAMLLFLLDQLTRQENKPLAGQVQLQLGQMIGKGLYDPVHGGFHRYSTDAQWLQPHFEKMLYNQGQLLLVYSRAANMFGKSSYKAVLKDIIGFLRLWLYQPSAGLYSAIDADYQGQEGKFYLWTAQELAQIPQAQSKAAGLTTYDFTSRQGIYFSQPSTTAASQIRAQLRALRSTQQKPLIDKKIITGWNALVIWGLIEAYEVLKDDSIKTLAVEIAQVLWSNHYSATSQQLYRASFNGLPTQSATLGDYSYLAKAMVRLFDITDNQEWLTRAQLLTRLTLAHFKGDDHGFFVAAIGDNNNLGLNLKQSKDGELLAAGAVMVEVLHDLWLRTGKVEFKKSLKGTGDYLKAKVQGNPLNHLYAASVINRLDNKVNNHSQYFAGGRGRISVVTPNTQAVCAGAKQLAFKVQLKDGWHINSSAPLQSHLRPTKAVFESVEKTYQVNYPKAEITRLGFQKAPLSVYQGAFLLGLENHKNNQQSTRISIHVQPCSDKVCLLPEELRFFLPSCPDL